MIRAAIATSRLARLAVHLLHGLWIVHTRYARLSPIGQNHELERWSRKLLGILRIRIAAHNAPERLPGRCLVVLNHVSWLDIFALYAAVPCLFVAKSEIRRWPLVGVLVARVGTLFIERGSRRHAREMNRRIVDAIAAERVVAVCPEGTTTDGRSLAHFHAALVQPAIDANAAVLPLALRYLDRTAIQSDAAAYVGETSLMESMWRIAREPSMTVELRFAEPIDARGRHRRELATHARSAIAAKLDLPPPHTAIDRAADPLAGSPSTSRPTHTPYPTPVDPA
jgi:1-acyl-sn-glycerol-3-phosphate acyltransferase